MIILHVTFWIVALLFVYAQIGYGMFLRCVLKLRGPLPDLTLLDDDQCPSVSLVIPVYNEEDVIEAKLRNTAQIDYPADKLEVLVANDGSNDSTVALASHHSHPNLRILDNSQRQGKPGTVNNAVAQAQGDVLCLCDANVMFVPDAIRRLVSRLHESASIGAVSGDVRLASEQSDFGEGESAYYQLERVVQLAESRLDSVMGVDGGMYVIRRELYRPIAPDTIVDDFVISMNVIRQGARVLYEPSAVAHENGTPGTAQEFGRRIRLSAGAMQVLLRRHCPPLRRPIACFEFLSHKVLRWAGPLWMVALLVLNIILMGTHWIYLLGLVGQGLFYGIATLAWLVPSLRGNRIAGIIFYFVMSHVAMALGLLKGLLGWQAVAWNRTARQVGATS